MTPGIASASDVSMLSDLAVGDGGAHVGDVSGAGQQRLVEQVVDVHAAGGEELRVFLAKNPVTQNAASHAKPPDDSIDDLGATLDACRRGCAETQSAEIGPARRRGYGGDGLAWCARR